MIISPLLVLGPVSLALGLATSSHAAVLLQDNFDSYASQAAFEAAWAVVGTQPSGTLNNTDSVSPSNSISYPTAATTAASARNERAFTESGVVTSTSILRFSVNFYDSNASINPYREYTNLQDGASPAGSAQLISLGLNNNLVSTNDGGNYYMARILGYTPTFAPPTNGTNPATASGAYFKLNDSGAPLRSTGWHQLAVEISPTEFRFYVDGILSETVANTFTLRSYDLVRLGSGLSTTSGAAFDNVSIETIFIPEPGLGLLALAGFTGLAAARRRR
jgi:hypothetical protein